MRLTVLQLNMKAYLLLFLSSLFLLFTLPKNTNLHGVLQQHALRQSCSSGKSIGKKNCARKCLKHQTHTERKGSPAGITPDCNQQTYAILHVLQPVSTLIFPVNQGAVGAYIRSHLSPDLERDPEPPRLS